MVVDLGANIGLMAVEIAKRGVRKVRAYEPHPVNFAVGRDHVVLNGVTAKVDLYCAAVVPGGMRGKAASTHLYLAANNNAAHSTAPVAGRTMAPVASVPAHTVFLADVTAMKIDIEGAEYDIIDYVRLCPKLRLLVVELHLTRAEWKNAAKHFTAKLREFGFRALRKPVLDRATLWRTVGTWTRAHTTPAVAKSAKHQLATSRTAWRAPTGDIRVISLSNADGKRRRRNIGILATMFTLLSGVPPSAG